MKKLLSLSLILLMLSACTSSETLKDLEYITNKGTLSIGLDDTFPPMGFRDENNKIVGFDIDVANKVAEIMNVEPDFQPIEWQTKEQELATKRIDVIWNGFSITPEREKNLNFSTPYMDNKMSIITKNSITSISQLSGKKLGMQGASSAEKALDSNNDFKSTLSDIITFPNNTTALLDLETGGVDAILMDSVTANYIKNKTGKDFSILPDALASEEYAIGMRKGDDELTKTINSALETLKQDGSLSEISIKWFGEDLITLN